MLNRAFVFLVFLLSLAASLQAKALNGNDEDHVLGAAGSLVRRDERRQLVLTEYGTISAVDISDGNRGPYHIQFITLEPNSLLLPVLLHASMVFYVHTGSGILNWAHDEDDMIKKVAIKRGDIYRLHPGSVFFVQSNLETERQKLRIKAIFANTDDDLYDPSIGAYSSIRDLIRGFDTKVLQAAFKVSEEVIQSITNTTDQSAIVHALPTKKETFWDTEARLLKAFLGVGDGMSYKNKKKKKKDKKMKTYNVFDEEPDFTNCNGWSLTVNQKTSPLLRGSNIGLFMVNLTKGSMMGPHWNPRATEIATVLHGEGMVRVVCSSTAKKSECRNMRFRVQEGDVFAVPMFHPMAQMSFNNDSLVFMGFSTTTRRNNPQFIAGKYSVLQTLNKQVLAVSFNVTNTTIDQLLAAQADSIIIDCTSCAEEEQRVMQEEIEKEREEREEEEARKREEEEARKREEEEAARKREEEEEAARKREEEEARKREEEEEARKREEEQEEKEREEKERQQEEERRQEEEKERERQEEEDWERRQQEEARREEDRQRREEEAQREQEEARRQEEDRRRREEEAQGEQEEDRRQEEEREGRGGQEQEEDRRQQDEREGRGGQEQEDDRRQHEEREGRGGQEQEEDRRQQEGRGGQEQEEREGRGRQEQEEDRRQEGRQRSEEEAQREQEEPRSQQEEREGRGRQEEEGREDWDERQEAPGRQPEEQYKEGGRGIDYEGGRRYLNVKV